MDEVARRPTEDMRESVQNVRSVSENALGVQGADTGDVRHFLADALGTGSFSKVALAARVAAVFSYMHRAFTCVPHVPLSHNLFVTFGRRAATTGSNTSDQDTTTIGKTPRD